MAPRRTRSRRQPTKKHATTDAAMLCASGPGATAMAIDERGGIDNLGAAMVTTLDDLTGADSEMNETEPESEVTLRGKDATGVPEWCPSLHMLHTPNAHQLFRLAYAQRAYL